MPIYVAAFLDNGVFLEAPTTDGDPFQFMVTDGSGVLSFYDGIEGDANGDAKLIGHIYRDGDVANVVVANAVTIDLSAGNHQSLDLSAATGDVTLTWVAPTNNCAGSVIVTQDTPARDITHAKGAGVTQGVWHKEPAWSSDADGSRRLITWRFAGGVLHLSATVPETATF